MWDPFYIITWKYHTLSHDASNLIPHCSIFSNGKQQLSGALDIVFIIFMFATHMIIHVSFSRKCFGTNRTLEFLETHVDCFDVTAQVVFLRVGLVAHWARHRLETILKTTTKMRSVKFLYLIHQCLTKQDCSRQAAYFQLEIHWNVFFAV